MAFSGSFALLCIQLFMLPLYITAQTHCSITPGSYLTAANGSSSVSWQSTSGEFAFGFRQASPNADTFLLAIWFAKTPEKTTAWFANGQNLVPHGSTVKLTTNGSLELAAADGRIVWSTVGGATCAAMLDTGNFVLTAGNGSDVVWQSYDFPTDTLLPTQTMSQVSRLVARFSESNYTTGRFQLRLQEDGNLVLYTTARFPYDAVNFAYYATNTFGSGFRLVFSKLGSLTLEKENGTVWSQVFPEVAAASSSYLRVVLDSDGVLRQYVRPKSGGGGWTVASFVPENICTRITGDTGSGACGFNSYCELRENWPVCRCPTGYGLLDTSDERGGCRLLGFDKLGCGGGEQGEMIHMPDTDWPLSDYELYVGVSEELCSKACLEDCFCGVAIFRSGRCWKKKLPLSNGRLDASVGGKALIKILRTSNSTA